MVFVLIPKPLRLIKPIPSLLVTIRLSFTSSVSEPTVVVLPATLKLPLITTSPSTDVLIALSRSKTFCGDIRPALLLVATGSGTSN